MQLNLFEWDNLAVSSGYDCLVEFDFEGARDRFARVLQARPDHREARRSLDLLSYWQRTLAETDDLPAPAAARLLWRRLETFPFDSSGRQQRLRHAIMSRLLLLTESLPEFYEPPDLCSGYLLLLLGDYEIARTRLEELLRRLPARGILFLFLAEALWLQGKRALAAPHYATALLLDPRETARRTISHAALAALIAEHGGEAAPLYGYFAGLLPLVELPLPGRRPLHRTYELLRNAELARQNHDHEGMIGARRQLKALAPDIFEEYLSRLDGPGSRAVESAHLLRPPYDRAYSR